MKKEEAIRYLGSAAELARILKISEAAVSQWGEIIPQGRAYQIESLTGGELKVNQADYANPSEGPQSPALEQ